MLERDLRYPVGINLSKGFTRVLAVLRLERTDKDTIRGEKVRDGSSLSEELRVGKDVKAAVGFGIGFEDGTH